MKLYITRHGQTEYNLQNKIMGRVDLPLNEEGITQAYEVKQALKDRKIDLIICSPLKRAVQTAAIINEGRDIPVLYDERIIERDYGEFEGSDKNTQGYKDLWNYGLNRHYEKAENIKDCFTRIYSFLDDIKKTYEEKDILLVCHGGISMPVACYFSGKIPEGSLSGTGLALRNCQVREYDL